MNPKTDLTLHATIPTGQTRLRLKPEGARPPRTRITALLVLPLALCALPVAKAQEAKAQYPAMAPVAQYLMTDRNAEIALARSAAPEAISRDATVLIMDQNGYETA